MQIKNTYVEYNPVGKSTEVANIAFCCPTDNGYICYWSLLNIKLMYTNI